MRKIRGSDWFGCWAVVAVFLLAAGSALALELVRQKNVATVIQFPLVGSSDDVAFTDCTAGADTEYSTFTDGTAGPSAYTDITNEIALTASATGIHWVSLTASEMNADYITILVKSSSCNTLYIPIRTVAANPHYQAATDDGGVINVTTGAVDTVTTTTTATTATTCNALGTQAKADVNAEADAALADVNLDHLVGTATGIPAIVAGTYLDQVMDDGTATYDRTTDSLQALRDNVATGSEIVGLIFSEPVPGSYTSGMFGYVVGTNLNATVSSRSTLDAAAVNTEVDTALADIHLDHLLAVDYDPASKPGVATALLNELVESDGGVSRFTANALEQAPSGGGSDPWITALPGAYSTGQAGYILGNLLDLLDLRHGPGPWVK